MIGKVVEKDPKEREEFEKYLSFTQSKKALKKYSKQVSSIMKAHKEISQKNDELK